MTENAMPVVQVAFTALDAPGTAAWYESMFGYRPAGSITGTSGDDVAEMMALPDVHCDMHWLVDSNDFFQLEIFRFHQPVSSPAERSPDSLGWSMVGLRVADLDEVLARLRDSGAHVGPVHGAAGARRVCTRDPEGVWLELRERDSRSGDARDVRATPVSTAFVRAVVTDLDAAAAFFSDTLGLRDTGSTLHTDADEALWGSAPTRTDTLVLSADGRDTGIVIELVHYPDRVARPLPDGYRISDRGILNVAFGSREVNDYDAVIARLDGNGYPINGELAIGPARSSYANGADGLSVELLTIPDPEIEQQFGFTLAAQTTDVS
ncbi:VOC family protein [Gordonia sp. PKS22-38]|uniref:VOC family protein n=1 Tax=Gordonia prachuapensis TaxID=3115651 RepID=A0ABU7MUM2_9ACTN|nr:VOC family protein [Gordonia sp. PKS22-38]